MTDFRAPVDQNKDQITKDSTFAKPAEMTLTPNGQGDTPVSIPVEATVVKDRPLDKIMKKLVGFVARLTGNPDPITGAPNKPSVSGEMVQNVWNKTNDVIEKAGVVTDKVGDVAKKTIQVTGVVVNKVSDVAKKTVEVTTSAINQVKEIKQEIVGGTNKNTQPLGELEKK